LSSSEVNEASAFSTRGSLDAAAAGDAPMAGDGPAVAETSGEAAVCGDEPDGAGGGIVPASDGAGIGLSEPLGTKIGNDPPVFDGGMSAGELPAPGAADGVDPVPCPSLGWS